MDNRTLPTPEKAGTMTTLLFIIGLIKWKYSRPPGRHSWAHIDKTTTGWRHHEAWQMRQRLVAMTAGWYILQHHAGRYA